MKRTILFFFILEVISNKNIIAQEHTKKLLQSIKEASPIKETPILMDKAPEQDNFFSIERAKLAIEKRREKENDSKLFKTSGIKKKKVYLLEIKKTIK